METAVIAKIAVSAAPYSIDKPYDYRVPEALNAAAVPGVRVIVPFGRGNRNTEGIILACSAGERTKGLKSVSGSRCWIRMGLPWRFGCVNGISVRSLKR